MPATDRSLITLLETWRRRDAESRRPPVDAEERPGAARGRPAAEVPLELLPYGVTDERPEPACEIVATLGSVQTEYASLRRDAGLLVSPHRATIEVAGGDRRDFLDRLLTAALADLGPGEVRPAFLLDRKGRIGADLLVVELGDRTLLDVDVLEAETTVARLEAVIFTEDVAVADVSEGSARLALHGPAAADMTGGLEDRRAKEIALGGAPVIAARRDQVAAPGIELFAPIDAVEAAWGALVDGPGPAARPIGWHAYNVARIEAGTPLFNVDFGPSNLPHETGVLHDRVSFRKGCYPGQEIVARIESLGRPKQVLVGLRPAGEHLPVAGAQVFGPGDGELGAPAGVVTSSALSPMLGAAPIAFAMLRTEIAEGGRVRVVADGELVDAAVGPLRSWPPETPAGATP